jgi:hypothetical protein
MQAIEFETDINEAGEIRLPEAAVSQLPAGVRARVIVLWGAPHDSVDSDWDRLAARRISEYYAPEDGIYDDYPRG